MTKVIKRNIVEIDATGRAVGRVATEAAMKLMGKNKADFERYIDTGDFVVINNVNKVKFTGRKLEQKDFFHHTMHPGSLKREPMKKMFETNPARVMRHAIDGMLPKNKLRKEMLKRLTINA